MYGIRNCVEYDFHDYKVAGLEADRLRLWCDELGWEALLNRAGTTFRKLDDAGKRDLNRQKALALMLAQPSMIKRPVIQIGERLVVGFKSELYKTIEWL